MGGYVPESMSDALKHYVAQAAVIVYGNCIYERFDETNVVYCKIPSLCRLVCFLNKRNVCSNFFHVSVENC